ncbi:MAG: hypothetical protein IJ623_06885 [Bacteroidales bacterium]|nr:hypothetical protein [Bacteroidales bacterium]
MILQFNYKQHVMQRRIFYRDILNHCYQRTADGGVLFYSYSDHLVYFTNYCVQARKHNIHVLALCQMPDHIHDILSARKVQDMENFKRDLHSSFAKTYNSYWGIHGPVFEYPYGNAPKKGVKNGRSAIIYVANNPVERQLTDRAENYRWGYWAYAFSACPFSDKLVLRDASAPMAKAVKEVRAQFNRGLPMNYAMLKRMFSALNPAECQQLTDFIISTYNVIDFESASRYFEDDMLHAMHVNTSKEHDLNELFIGKSDKPYQKMIQIVLEEGGMQDIHDMLSLDKADKQKLLQLLRRRTDVMTEQIGKFLHLPIKRA